MAPMRSASRRGSAYPAPASVRAAAVSAAAIVTTPVSGTLALLLAPCGAQRTDQLVQPAVQHVLQVVHGEVDAVVGHPILGEVVRANLRRAITGADHRAALAG